MSEDWNHTEACFDPVTGFWAEAGCQHPTEVEWLRQEKERLRGALREIWNHDWNSPEDVRHFARLALSRNPEEEG